MFRKLWEDGGRDSLPRAEVVLCEAASVITARLCQAGKGWVQMGVWRRQAT